MHGTQNSDHIKHMFFRRLPQNMPIIVGEVPYQYSDIRSNGPSAPGIVYGNNSKRCPGFIYLHAKSSNGVVLWMPHDVINLVMIEITRYIYLPRDRIYLKVKIGQNSWGWDGMSCPACLMKSKPWTTPALLQRLIDLVAGDKCIWRWNVSCIELQFTLIQCSRWLKAFLPRVTFPLTNNLCWAQSNSIKIRAQISLMLMSCDVQ